jgi:hypothetical protein
MLATAGLATAVAAWRHCGVSSLAGAALPPRTALVATKTPAVTAMAGVQTTINNQLNDLASTATTTTIEM